MSKISIAVDSGKYLTKSIGVYEGKQISNEPFMTRFYEFLPTESLDAYGSDNYTVEFEGKRYIVGSQGNKNSYDLDKSSFSHKLATYVAMSQIVKGFKLSEPVDVNLTIGTPLSVYRSLPSRKEARDYILGNGHFNINVDSIPYSININNCLVFPEAGGVVYVYPEMFRNKRTVVIDIGGLNVNVILFDNLKPDPENMFTMNLGFYNLESEVNLKLSSKFNLSLSAADINRAMSQRGLRINGEIVPESTSVINEICDEHVSKILREIRKKNLNLETLDIVFIGGTSSYLKSYIKQHLSHSTVVENAWSANVEGFLKAMRSIENQ